MSDRFILKVKHAGRKLKVPMDLRRPQRCVEVGNGGGLVYVETVDRYGRQEMEESFIGSVEEVLCESDEEFGECWAEFFEKRKRKTIERMVDSSSGEEDAVRSRKKTKQTHQTRRPAAKKRQLDSSDDDDAQLLAERKTYEARLRQLQVVY